MSTTLIQLLLACRGGILEKIVQFLVVIRRAAALLHSVRPPGEAGLPHVEATFHAVPQVEVRGSDHILLIRSFILNHEQGLASLIPLVNIARRRPLHLPLQTPLRLNCYHHRKLLLHLLLCSVSEENRLGRGRVDGFTALVGLGGSELHQQTREVNRIRVIRIVNHVPHRSYKAVQRLVDVVGVLPRHQLHPVPVPGRCPGSSLALRSVLVVLRESLGILLQELPQRLPALLLDLLHRPGVALPRHQLAKPLREGERAIVLGCASPSFLLRFTDHKRRLEWVRSVGNASVTQVVIVLILGVARPVILPWLGDGKEVPVLGDAGEHAILVQHQFPSHR
mmetsp:Transcript_68736/g.157656  ORF Transcript_68736/g.157656 Transcript_68736/m.157656 type:complete len:337 (-) Transcript_68736:121-1131(-)